MCRSYSCLTSGDQSRDTSNIGYNKATKVTYEVHQFRALQIAEGQYYDALKRGTLISSKNTALEIQLTQTMVWVRAYLTRQKKCSTTKLEHAAAALEQILNFISMKKDKRTEQMLFLFNKRCIDSMDNFSPKEFYEQKFSQKVLTTRKKQALKQISKRRLEYNIFSEQLESPKLSFSDIISIYKLNSMNSRRFKANAISTMCTAIGKLDQEYTRRWSRIESKKFSDFSATSRSFTHKYRLNVKAKSVKATWKNTLEPLTYENETIGRQVRISKRKNARKLAPQRWNGKFCVKVRRSIALKSWLDMDMNMINQTNQ